MPWWTTSNYFSTIIGRLLLVLSHLPSIHIDCQVHPWDLSSNPNALALHGDVAEATREKCDCFVQISECFSLVVALIEGFGEGRRRRMIWMAGRSVHRPKVIAFGVFGFIEEVGEGFNELSQRIWMRGMTGESELKQPPKTNDSLFKTLHLLAFVFELLVKAAALVRSAPESSGACGFDMRRYI